MPPIRVLIVDDAVTVRRLVADALSADPAIQVVGSAANGRQALERIPHVQPDIVILDIEMPEMDGLETLVELRRRHPKLPVIVFSSDTHHGAAATLDALWLGAKDYVTKTGASSFDAAIRHIRSEMVPRIHALCDAARDAQPGSGAASAPVRARDPRAARSAAPHRSRESTGRVDVLAIGASAGGPSALSVLLADLPADLPVPVLIVQHMPPRFTGYLAERLAAKSRLRIAEAVPEAPLEPGRVWIAPGDFHMTVERSGAQVVTQLDRNPPENSCRPSADPLFRTVAEVFGAGALCVVLTGMGQDALRGCREVARARGQILVQDEASSVVWGMPGNVAREGLADRVLPLDQLAEEILRRVWIGRAREAA
jgi:two-component system chemotaxis response regulator CheB